LSHVLAQPYLSPPSPILLYPVNRTFSITCSLLCDDSIELDQLIWLVDGQALSEDRHQFSIETTSFNTQRLTVFLNKKTSHFGEANYTCKYHGKESTVLVRRRTSTYLFLFASPLELRPFEFISRVERIIYLNYKELL
jgi:hypothetical protein